MNRDDFEIDDCGPVKLVYIKPGRIPFIEYDLEIDCAQFHSTKDAERAIAKHIAGRKVSPWAR